jgi:hypothetical protein
VSRAAGEDNKVANIGGGKYFRSFAGHDQQQDLGDQQYTTAAQLKQQDTAISPSER